MDKNKTITLSHDVEVGFIPTRVLRFSAENGPLTDNEILRRRNEDWRIQYDEGYVDVDGVRRKRSMPLIARIYDKSVSTVFEGIRQARAIRRALDDAGDRD